MAGGADPGGSVDVDPRVALVGDQRHADVDPHANADVALAGPLLLDERVLALDGSHDRVVERLEGGEDLVAVRVDDETRMVLNRVAEDAPHAVEDRRVV